MFESVFQSFEKLISEFSWRRLVFLVMFLVMAASIVWLWENNTGQMRLTRIERTIAILNSIKDIQDHPVMKSDPALNRILSSLKDDLKEFSEHNAQPVFLGAKWRKAFAGGAIWLLFSLLYLPALRTRENNELQALIGCLIMAVFFGVIGVWLPDFAYPWLNFILYPVTNFIIIMAIAFLWQARKRARIKKQSGAGLHS